MANAPDRIPQSSAQIQSKYAERPWLSALKDYITNITTEAAGEFWPPRREGHTPYYNYRLEHVLQVERDALRIHAVERGDLDIILAAVWSHDRCQPQFSGEQHAERGAAWARDYLKFIRFPDNKIHQVCQAILLHSHSELDIPASLHEARVLWDADHVTRLGPADMLNFLLCHTSADFLDGLPGNGRFPDGIVTVRDFVPLLVERKPSMYRADYFYFNETRRMARERIDASRAFLDCLEGQI